MRSSVGILVWLACDEPNVWDLKSNGDWIGLQFHPEGYFVFPTRGPDLIQIAAGPYCTVEQAMEAVSAHLGSPCKPGVTL